MNNSNYGGDTLRHFNTAMASIAHFAGDIWVPGSTIKSTEIPVGKDGETLGLAQVGWAKVCN
jgi:hypothetical protein